MAFTEALLRERGTLVTPGTLLDLPGHVRLGLGAAPEAFADGLVQLEAFLNGE